MSASTLLPLRHDYRVQPISADRSAYIYYQQQLDCPPATVEKVDDSVDTPNGFYKTL
jgi:hypothetical protein